MFLLSANLSLGKKALPKKIVAGEGGLSSLQPLRDLAKPCGFTELRKTLVLQRSDSQPSTTQNNYVY